MTIVRKDKMLAGYNGNLESVKVFDADDNAIEVTNGVFVVIEGLLEGEREVKKARLATEADEAKDIYMIHNHEVQADEKKLIGEFRVKADKVARAYGIFNDDIVTFTDDLFTETVAVGDVLSIKADGKLGVSEELSEAKVKFNVIENSGDELALGTQAYAIQAKVK